MTLDVVLVTGQDMPVPDTEAPVLVDMLRQRGLSAELRQWGTTDGWRDVGLTVVRSTWDYTDRRHEFLVWLDGVASASRVVNPPSVIAWNSHKGYLLELAAAGVLVVPTGLVRQGASTAEQRAALMAWAAEVVVVKPAVGAGARGAMRGRRDEPELVEHLEQLVGHGDALVQPYVETIATGGEISLIFFGGELSHAVRKRPRAGDYRIHEHLGGSTEPHPASPAEIDVAERALAHVTTPNPLTYARVDLVMLDNGPGVMELELIEPFLFLDYAPGAGDRFVDVLMKEQT